MLQFLLRKVTEVELEFPEWYEGQERRFKPNDLARENICFSSLSAIGDVSRGGTSVTQRQKFHSDDVKSVWNPVRSADWSTE